MSEDTPDVTPDTPASAPEAAPRGCSGTSRLERAKSPAAVTLPKSTLIAAAAGGLFAAFVLGWATSSVADDDEGMERWDIQPPIAKHMPGPGQPGPMGEHQLGAPGDPGRGGMEGRHMGGAVVGQITSVDGKTLTVTTPDNKAVKVMLDDETKVKISSSGDAGDLANGDHVMVVGERSGDSVDAKMVHEFEGGLVGLARSDAVDRLRHPKQRRVPDRPPGPFSFCLQHGPVWTI
jgi:hypothetical protein